MRRPPVPVIAFLGTLAFAGGGYGTYELVRTLRPAAEPQQAAWSEQQVGSVHFSSPVPLKDEKVDLPDNVKQLVTASRYLAGEASGVTLAATAFTYKDGTQINLEGAADGALANIRAVPGIQDMVPAKKPATLLGKPAIDLEAKMRRDKGENLQLHGVVFASGPELFIFMMIAKDEHHDAAETWHRLRKSIRL